MRTKMSFVLAVMCFVGCMVFMSTAVTLWLAAILTRPWPFGALRAFKRRLLRERKTRRVVWHMLSGWKALKRVDAVFQGE